MNNLKLKLLSIPGIAVLILITAVYSFASEEKENGKPHLSLKDLESYTEIEEVELPVIDNNSTLEDYLAYAALSNPQLKSAFKEWKAVLYTIPQVRSLPDPRLNFAWFIQEVETRVGPQEQKIGLSQIFPWFGKLGLQEDIAHQKANALHEHYQSIKLKLFYQVKSIYYEYYYLSRAIETTRKNMELLKNLEAVARAKYRTGAGLSDTIQAQVELGKLDDQLNTLLDLKKPLAIKFNAVLNRPFQLDLAWPESVVIELVFLEENTLTELLSKHNPELKMLDFNLEKERHKIDLAKKDYYPDFMFGLDYIATDRALNPTRDNGKDPLVAMVSINLPIWRSKYKAAVIEAKSRYSAVTETLVNKENQLIADVTMAHYHFRDANRKISLFKDTLIPKANQSLNVIKKSYEGGNTEFLSLIDAERVLLEFELSYDRAVANRMQRLAEIEMLIGRSLPTQK